MSILCLPRRKQIYIQMAIHWNLIGRGISTRPPVLPPSSSLPSLTSHCACVPARRILARV